MRGAQDLPTDAGRDRDLLGATLQLLTEAGFSSLNFHGVASRAGISTGAIERDWNSKLDLVIAALDAAFAEHPVPDTGSFERGLPDATCATPPAASRRPVRAR